MWHLKMNQHLCSLWFGNSCILPTLSLYIYVYTAYIETDRLPHITQFETPSFYKGGGLTSSSRKGEVGLKGGLLRKGGIFCFDMKFL